MSASHSDAAMPQTNTRPPSTNAACPAPASVPCRAPMHATKFRAAIAAVALLAFAAPAVHAKPLDAPVTEAELAADIKVLASDAFEGRAPGTEGEDRTIAWIVGQWAKLGLEPVPGDFKQMIAGEPLAVVEVCRHSELAFGHC